MTRFLLLAALALSSSAPAETGAQITIEAFAFGPASRTVPVGSTVPMGSTVVWINQDVEPHTLVSGDHKFQSEALDNGAPFLVTLDKAGSYGNFRSLHPHMTGKVVVK